MDSRDKFARQGGYQAPVLLVELDDGDYDEVELPTHFVVCPLCEGKGKHVNPSVDANGLGRGQMEDEDFMHDYMSGVYDITCNSCNGRRVVKGLDESRCTDGQLDEYYKQQQEQHDVELEMQAELRMGA